jgi:hypothetical protein
VTSGGMERGADPILERHGELVVKGLVEGCWKAGSRKEGIEVVGELEGGAEMLRARRRCMGVSIVAIDGR